jgi:ankyrin repeat protein
MYAAALNRDPIVITVLIEAGAKVNDRDSDGVTPVMIAARANRNPAVITALLKGGADGAEKSGSGKTAFDYAASNESLRETVVYATLEKVQAFFQFVRTAAPEKVQAAIAAGAKVDEADEDGWSPLMYAAARNPGAKVITVLLKAGASIDYQDPDGWTPLMAAAKNNRNPAVIMTLLNAGANGKLTSKEGKTAFDYAATNESVRGTAAYRALARAKTPVTEKDKEAP